MEVSTHKLKTKKYIISALMVFVFVIIDQLTKQWAVRHLYQQDDIQLIPNVLQFHYLENTGAAFSMLEQKMMFFYILTPILLIIMLYFFVKIPYDNKRFLPLQLIILFLCAGAIGNYIDRLLYGYVIDFIYFSLINFPVFNVADIYVTCSVIALFIFILFYYKDDEIEQLLPKHKIHKEK